MKTIRYFMLSEEITEYIAEMSLSLKKNQVYVKFIFLDWRKEFFFILIVFKGSNSFYTF